MSVPSFDVRKRGQVRSSARVEDWKPATVLAAKERSAALRIVAFSRSSSPDYLLANQYNIPTRANTPMFATSLLMVTRTSGNSERMIDRTSSSCLTE